MAEKTLDHRLSEALEAWRQADPESPEKGETYLGYEALLDERDRGRAQAVTDGLALGRNLTPAETFTVRAEIQRFLDHLDDAESIDEAAKLTVARAMAEEYSSDDASWRLRLKMLVAFEMEWAVNEDTPIDGILGSALDRAMETMAPYGGHTWERMIAST